MNKHTLVLGASEKTERYSNKAIRMLRHYNHTVSAIGNKRGIVLDVPIETEQKEFKEIDTITIYLGAARQTQYYDYILGIKPTRIIFNPGAENPELYDLATKAGIQAVEACTLVLLSTGQY